VDNFIYHGEIPEFVTLASQDPTLSLPDPRYLKLHAACGRVAHLSGAGEHVDRVLRDAELVAVLANDGSSADSLRYALGLLSHEEVAVYQRISNRTFARSPRSPADRGVFPASK
jgi:hypothetical protein